MDGELRGETILILANAEWDWETRVNCHHIAARLARANDVLFVDTIGGRTPGARDLGKIVRRLKRIAGGIRTIGGMGMPLSRSALTAASDAAPARSRVLAPFVIPVYQSELIRRINTAILAWQIRRAIPRTPKPILWIFLPAHVGLVGKLNEKLVIYHCVDEHAANPNVPAKQVIEREQQLLKLADLVFTTSSTLYESKRASNPHTFYLPNVADVELFGRARQPELESAADLDRIPRPIAGFIGNITAYKLDFDLIAAVAEQNPQWSFVLIGPIGRGDPSTDVAKLATLKNIFLLGPRPYNDLPRYVKAFAVCLIPFRMNDSTRGTLPMKFFEYLAAGRAVIATDLPTLAEFREYFYPAHNAQEFSSALERARNENDAGRAARIAIAQKYSWDARMLEIGKIVREALDKSRKR